MIIKLKDQTYWRVAMKSDVDSLFPGRNRMIQAMKDLLPIISSHISEGMHERWTDRRSSRLDDLFPLFLAIIKDCLHTPVSGFDIQYLDDKYIIDIYCYPKLDQNYKFYYASFDFLPELKKRDKKLHDMCVEMFRILVVNCQVVPTDSDEADDQFVENEIENTAYDTEMKDDLKEFIQSEIDAYHEHAERYYKLFREKRGDPDKLRKMISKYEVNLEAERLLIDAMQLLLKANDEPGNLDYFSGMAEEKFAIMNDVPKDDFGNFEYSDGSPVAPWMTMRLGWFSWQSFTEMQTQWLGDLSGNFGQADYCDNYRCEKPGDIDKAYIQFTQDTGMFLEYLGDYFIHMERSSEAIMNLAEGKLTAILFEDGSGQSGLSASESAENIPSIL